LSRAIRRTQLHKLASTIPIVFTQVSEPVDSGFVTSLAQPGGHITGFQNFEPAMGGKWLGILKEIGPDQIDQWRGAAQYIDRILKGEHPAHLPVQAPIKFETVINLKTAKAGRSLEHCGRGRVRRASRRVDTRYRQQSWSDLSRFVHRFRPMPQATAPSAVIPFVRHLRMNSW
jgi:hypothetical protein